MTEANLRSSTSDLCGLPTSCTTCIVFINRARSVHNSRTAIHFAMLGAIYIGHSSTRHVHNLMKKKSQLYTYFGSEGRLVLPLFVAEIDGLCTQFEEKQLCTLVT